MHLDKKFACHVIDRYVLFLIYLCNTDWRTAEAPTKAIKHVFEGLKERGKKLLPLQLYLNSEDEEEERNCNLISFHKQKNLVGCTIQLSHFRY